MIDLSESEHRAEEVFPFYLSQIGDFPFSGYRVNEKFDWPRTTCIQIMDQIKTEKKKELRKQRKTIKRKKKNALVVCHDGKQFWTTQDQFWQWVRERVIIKLGDFPLSGKFVHENTEKDVVICNTILNLACANHLSEAIYSRRFRSS